jgi:uncharacterized coiled-coil protein SlyX
MKRKCAYTGKDSFCTDKPLPSQVAEQEIHNWTNALPCSIEYKESKQGQSINDIELKIHETFYLLEIARFQVKFLENKLKELQDSNNTRTPIKKTGASQKNKEKKKEDQIQAAIAVKDEIKSAEQKIEELLKNKKKGIF